MKVMRRRVSQIFVDNVKSPQQFKQYRLDDRVIPVSSTALRRHSIRQ